jgi:apolipoprotein N-acyltransferase
MRTETLYTRWGDYLAVGFTAMAGLLLLFGGIVYIIIHRRKV